MIHSCRASRPWAAREIVESEPGIPVLVDVGNVNQVRLCIHINKVMYTLYMSVTDPMNITEARKQLAAIIDQVRAEHEPVYLTRRGRRVAAVIDADDLAVIIDLAEDMADIRAAEAARTEMELTGEQPIPWEDVKAELGLT